MKLSEEYRIILIDGINDYEFEFEPMVREATNYGISDFSISPNGRIITVEVDKSCEGIRDIVAWLASTLPFVELIGQIIQVDTYEPRWIEEEVNDNVHLIDFD